MCTKEPTIRDLPVDLQDLVLQFAYNMRRPDVLDSLEQILDIKDMQLPFFFFRERIWSWHYAMFLPNPINQFLPIVYFGGSYSDIFDTDSFFSLLIGLDFRRKKVKCFGSRTRWLDRMLCSWEMVKPFSSFYKMLLRSKTPTMKMCRSRVRMFI
jgi:hypothetical protein